MLQFECRPVSQATEDQAVEHAAQPLRESEARASRNPARSGTRKMDLTEAIREAQQPLVERLGGGVEQHLDGAHLRDNPV